MYYDTKAKAADKSRIQELKTVKKSEYPRKTGQRNRLRKEETILTARLRETYKNTVFSAR